MGIGGTPDSILCVCVRAYAQFQNALLQSVFALRIRSYTTLRFPCEFRTCERFSIDCVGADVHNLHAYASHTKATPDATSVKHV